MPPAIKQYFQKVTSYWADRTMSQRILLLGLALSVTVAFVLMIYWLNKPDYRVLYSKLYPEDAAKIVEMLKAGKDKYQLQDNGQTILVPADRVYDLRLKIAGEGNLHGQGIGFEIFDDLKIGQTDFVQQINYQRALQGELSRTISEFPQVEKARVHLVMPHKSLFIEDQLPPSASVVLKLKDKGTLEPKQIQGIVNLVSMSVEGLDKKRITITDMNGQPLYIPEDESTPGLSTTQLDYKAQMERKLERRIEELLMPVVGPQKVIARVNADLDFSQKTIRKEMYDPNATVVRSENRSEETTQGRAAIDGGAPEANFRGDGFAGTQSTQDSTREARTTNYEINKEEQSIVSPVGELQRLSVAVIVDGTYAKDAQGQMAYTPRSAEEMQRIQNLVRSAVGFDRNRGDAVEVSNISFGAPELEDGQTLMRTMLEYAQRLGKPFLNGLLIFLFLILVVRPVIMALIRPRVAEQEISEVAGLPGMERLAIEEGEMDEEALDAARKLENIKAQALQLSEQNMEQAVRLLKVWIKQEA
ncbi:MAG TPA: flagellar basal-body MS-ring/collar protein FliF [Desulfovibrio sp.]|uniref:flagellar basal-body MS-ring/collar protein FliF n=1 Tax=Desulfovibrio sp. TaxID=885 RepID=UPI002A47AD6C|nr:flagellar basal-body MS-ring/collar protein FliF [Desulfovibrio sp.]MDY0306979.1 flagellar basal-body MS-ring/collar protein FliF [Desulfovibrionaceae bacterium]HMM38958.1 flagellar basal-body MS-ring/collar protein FliF [Desulfovibrio sp.]